jgi:hypothetical protein
MTNSRHIICGDLHISDARLGDREALRLHLHGSHRNARLSVAELTKSLVANIPDAFLDLIEIATYVYVTDQAVKRGSYKLDDMNDQWRRRLVFEVPVRCLDLWRSNDVVNELTQTLSFLSDDEYEFRFHHYKNAPSPEKYFPFAKGAPKDIPKRVVLFSGGLDSLAGAVEEVVLGSDPICLLTHEPSAKFRPRQQLLRKQLDAKASGPTPLHVTVGVNKKKYLNKEYTQRSRSFLYASLAAAVAQMAGLPGIRFYENGVVSINLPIAADVVGGRATRTTHPFVLNGFGRLFTLLAGGKKRDHFTVENGFLWKTKSDVVRSIVDAQCGNLIEASTSCTHSWTWTRQKTHCGACTQCVDRRFAVLSAGAEAFDPGDRYKLDLLLSPRPKDEDRRLIACYVETMRMVGQMSQADFKEHFGGIFRVARQLPGTVDDNIRRVFELYRRHGREVTSVLAAALSTHRDKIINRTLPANCLLQMVHDLSVPAEGMVSTAPEKRDDADDAGQHVLRRNGVAWEYRFEGKKLRTLLPSKGASYLHVLLSSPGKDFSVASLVLEVAKAPQAYQFDAGEPILDDKAKQAIWAEYQELGQRIADAERHSREGEAAQLRQEQDTLLASMKEAGFKGKPKRLNDDRERHRKSFYMAIKRVIEEIDEFDKPFAAHLRACIRKGRTPSYRPPDGVGWTTA